MNLAEVIEPLYPIADKNSKKKIKNAKKLPAKKTVVSTFAGDGTAGFLNGPALAAKFKAPIDIVVLSDGSMYVADAFNSCIRKIEGGQVTTFAGNGNTNITDGNGSSARFKIPSRIAMDGEENLFVIDAADPRIRKITPAADVSTHAGENKFGFRDGETWFAQFGQSFGITIDIHGDIYIADSQNDCIRKISAAGLVSTLKIMSAQFRFVSGIALDKEGNLFVSDVTRIFKITPAGSVLTFVGSYVKGFADGKRAIARFSMIEDLITDDKGNLYVTDENRIRKITPEGVVSSIAGSTAGYNDGEGAIAKFDGPHGLGIDAEGNIYVADFNNRRIRKISFE